MTKPPRAYIRKDPTEWDRDGWTSCPNAILRHPELPWELRAVWAWLASHTAEFEITAEKLRQAGPKGRDWAYSAIKELERWGLLTRHHEIASGGQPVVRYHLHHRPVPEDQRTYEPPKATPRARQHPGTAERTPDGPGIRPELGVSDQGRSERIPDGSGQRTPDGSGVPYKEEKTREKTNQPGSGATPPVEPVPASPGWLDGPPQVEPQAPAAPTRGVEFLKELPTECRPDPHAVPKLAPKVDALLAGEWTWDSLKQSLTAGIATADRPAAALIGRLERLLQQTQAGPGAAEKRRVAAAAQSTEARLSADVRSLAIAACPLCDEHGYVDMRVCDHNPSQDETNNSGKARAWAAIGGRSPTRRRA